MACPPLFQRTCGRSVSLANPSLGEAKVQPCTLKREKRERIIW